MKRSINLRFLICLAVAAIVLVPGMHLLHGYQVKRNAGIFLDQAEKAQKDGDLVKAAGYYRLYLDLDPLDRHKALAKYGELLADERLAKSGKAKAQAYYKLEQALRREPERHDVRRLVIRLAMDPMLGRYGEALEELKVLNAALGEDAERLKLEGHCHVAMRQFKEARKALEKSLTLTTEGSTDFEAYLGLATLLRDKGAEVMFTEKDAKGVREKADATIEAMLARFAASHQARLGAAQYYRRFAAQIGPENSRKLADEQIVRAHELAPDQLEVILAYAALKQEAGKNEAQARQEARAELQRGLKLHAKERVLYQALANLEMLDGKPEAALATLRSGLKELPQNLDLMWNLALLFTHQGLESEAKEQIATLEKAGFPRTELDYLEVRISFKKARWQAAARTLEKIYPLLAGRADQGRDWLAIDLVYQSNLLLAQCYERMGDPYAASSIYARAVTRFPQHNVFRFGLARTEWSLGRLDNALREYDVLLSAPAAPVQAWVESLQLQIERTLRQPQREWSAIERKLDQAERLKVAPTEIEILRAEVLASKNEHDAARKVLESSHADKASRPVETWIGLAGVEQHRGRADAALALLDEAERLLGDRLELRQARCRYWARRGGAEAPRALDQINQGLEKFTAEQQERVASTLASSYLQIGETARAKEMWQRIAKQAPTDLRSRMALFDLALADNDQPAMSACVAAIRDDIEGSEGTLWRYCRASQLIAATQKSGDRRPLAEANDLLAAVAKRRPTWGRVMVAQGMLSDLVGNNKIAIERYQRAMALGEESVALIERTVRLLRSEGRLAEVDELLQRLPALAKGTYGELDRIGAESALRRQDLPKAITLANRAIPQESKDYRDHLWLGDFNWAAGKPAEAEAEIRLAIKLAPDVAATWVALVAHFARSGAKAKAAETVQEMEKALPNDRSQKNRLQLAIACELAGQSQRARELLVAALAAAPNDPDVLHVIAFSALRRNDLTEAKKYFEKLLTLTDSTPAKLADDKRLLAVVLASKNNYQERVKALRLLGVLDVDAPQLATVAGESVADQRAKIAILARAQNPRQRRQAIGLLEGMIGRQQITADERFLLARLYDSVGEWTEARQQYLIVLTAAPAAIAKDEQAKSAWQRKHADHLTAFCVGLLRNGAVEEMDPWLAKLEALEPKTSRSIGLRAQLLHRQGHGEKAVPELLALEKSQEKMTGPVAALLEQIGQVSLAEEMFKKLAAQTMKPEANLALAQFYGRQGRTDEALALCEPLVKAGSVEPVAGAAVMILYAGKPNNAQCQKVAGWLQSALEKNDKATALINHLAAVRRLQKDYAAVTALHRRIVQIDANDTLTLNNLAWVLALSGGDVAEALSAIGRAIELDGPLAELLDTRGVCHLKSGNADAAVKDFQEAIAETATAVRYFHLAQAQYLAKNRSAALDAFQTAVRLKLTEDVIDPLEAPAYHQLRAELEIKTTAGR